MLFHSISYHIELIRRKCTMNDNRVYRGEIEFDMRERRNIVNYEGSSIMHVNKQDGKEVLKEINIISFHNFMIIVPSF